MTPLERYGFPEGDEPRPVRCDSGYWTPWHVATEELKRLRAERERDDVAFELLVKEASLLRAERDALQWARNAELTYIISQITEIGRTLGASMDDGFCYSTHNLVAWATNRRDKADVVTEHAAALRGGEKNG